MHCLSRCLLLLLIFSFSEIIAQTAPSPPKERLRESFMMAYTNPVEGLALAQEVLDEVLSARDRDGEAAAYNTIGWNYFRMGKRDSAALFFEKGYALFLVLNEHSEASRVAYNYAEMLTAENKYSQALDQLVLADSLAALAQYADPLGNINRLKAILYREQHDYGQSEKYFRLAMDQFMQRADTARYIDAASSLGILYRKMERYDASVILLVECMALAEKVGGQMASLHENLGDTYYAMGQYKQALANFERSHAFFLEQQQLADVAYMAIALGKTHMKLGSPTQAERFLIEAVSLNDSLQTHNYKMEAAAELAELYRETANWNQAYHYLAMSNRIKDSLQLADQLKQVSELQAKYEAEKKELEITRLNAQNQRTRWQQYAIISIFVVSTVIALLIFNRYKMKRKLREQEVRNKIAADLHDDVGSTLSGINISSSIALLKSHDPTLVAAQLQKIQQQSKQTIDSIGDLVWSINPANDNFDKMVLRMKDFAATLLEPVGVEYEFRESGQIAQLKCEPEVRKSLYLIVKEALNNAVKYSHATRIQIELAMTSSLFIVSITDNGRGFELHGEPRGNGLKNMKSRMHQAGGELTVLSEPGMGTTIRAILPVT